MARKHHTAYVGVYLTPEQGELLKAYARDNSQSNSDVVRAALSRFFGQEGVELAPSPKKALKKPLRRPQA